MRDCVVMGLVSQISRLVLYRNMVGKKYATNNHLLFPESFSLSGLLTIMIVWYRLNTKNYFEKERGQQ